jgi:phospho-N-acetylmuramoyl-pentapeptide-transferase
MPEASFALTVGALTFILSVIWGSPLIAVLRALTILPAVLGAGFGAAFPFPVPRDAQSDRPDDLPSPSHGALDRLAESLEHPGDEQVLSEELLRKRQGWIDSEGEIGIQAARTMWVSLGDAAQAAEGDIPAVPTLGGLLILIPVALVTVGLNIVAIFRPAITGRSILVPLGVMLIFGAVGALDDWETMRGIRAEGMSPRLRLVGQFVSALGVALVLYFLLDTRSIVLPGFERKFDLGTLYIPVAAMILFAMPNAFDLHDGVDGLAGITAAMCFAAYGIIALLQGQIFLAQFCLTLVGAIVAFLWFNIYPASLNLGDSGSLALGASLGAVALMTGQWLILPVIALLPVAEALSIVIQYGYIGLSRLSGGGGIPPFDALPLHAHFKAQGWSDVQVFQRFWIAQILAVTLGVALALL